MYAVNDNKCWVWQKALDRGGYGVMRIGRKTFRAHRVFYERSHGLIPQGLVVDHLCRNRACVNPEHMEPVTIGENILRGKSLQALNKAKTHCIRGHEFTPENTYTHVASKGHGLGRWCLTCKKLRNRR